MGQAKNMQDILGRINDIAVFSGYVKSLDGLSAEQAAVVDSYVAARNDELVGLREEFNEAWARFNSRATQRQFFRCATGAAPKSSPQLVHARQLVEVARARAINLQWQESLGLWIAQPN